MRDKTLRNAQVIKLLKRFDGILFNQHDAAAIVAPRATWASKASTRSTVSALQA
jgi:hypothetical protein